MNRGALTAVLALAASAAVLALALVWLGRTTLRLEAAEAEARRRAALEEKVRLALWRMDSALTAFIGRENARAVEAFDREEKGSAAAAAYGPFTRRRFEISPRALGSPILPVAELAAVTGGAATIPQPPVVLTQNAADTQAMLNQAEFFQRSQNLAGQQSNFIGPGVQVPSAAPAPPIPSSRVETTLQPLWARGELYLVRRIRRGNTERLQGIWIDWPALRGWLLGQVRDLLPDADLLPGDDPAADPGRRIALLPARLSPGRAPALPVPAWTPARLTLAASSGAIALVVMAVATLLFGSLRQSQRRAEFVSAVTHELRTPLTTFRLYTDMLAEGMVAPAEQKDYLGTLRAEADRLGHLVENVLAYSRLERRPEPRLEAVPLADLLGELRDRLSGHASRAGMELAVQLPFPELADERVLVDRAAAERILLNLMDNACKYAAGGADARLEVQALRRGRHLVLRFQDRGPGISRSERRRLFRPFHKSAARAAGSVPGVGLGLPLSRRLARSMGGDLRLAASGPRGGAAFELWLRRAG
ncbi:MAG: hypothetical protein QOF89_5027 [Acidobacteriota bacterium]|jgi:signal transduction histidine kinase|nr:hypothetical protein [Acidobacteriota bacterium]